MSKTKSTEEPRQAYQQGGVGLMLTLALARMGCQSICWKFTGNTQTFRPTISGRPILIFASSGESVGIFAGRLAGLPVFYGWEFRMPPINCHAGLSIGGRQRASIAGGRPPVGKPCNNHKLTALFIPLWKKFTTRMPIKSLIMLFIIMLYR